MWFCWLIEIHLFLRLFKDFSVNASLLTNKYSEGYPGRRYYGGCHIIDEIETLAIERAKELFGAAYANVQPHSGSTANAAVFQALLVPGDTILGMSLAHGGHLTHGAGPSFSGKHYKAFQYGLDESSGEIDYDEVERLALEHKPKMVIAGFSAYSRIIDWQRFRDIADMVDAYLLVDMAHVAGLVATGDYPSPINIADVCTTTTHKTLRGPRGGLIVARANEEIEKKLNSAIFPGIQGGPLMHIIAAKAIAFGEALTDEFFRYTLQVQKNAKAMAEAFVKRGYHLISGGTDNHMMLIDLRNKNITGKEAENALVKAEITVNKNMVPFDDKSPFITSGIRVGTPAITTRGLVESDMETIVELIDRVLMNHTDEAVIEQVADEVNEMMGERAMFVF